MDDKKNDDRKHGPMGSPMKAAMAELVVLMVAAIPTVGSVAAAPLAASLQANTTRRLNEWMRKVEADLAALKRTPEEALRDEGYRQGLAQLMMGVVRQERDSKLDRIRNFLRHRLKERQPRSGITEAAVVRALEQLPAEHIEEFLRLLEGTEDDLRDFAIARGEMRWSIHEIVMAEIGGGEEQAYCGAPADVRWQELSVLFLSLSNAGLVREVPIVNGRGYETTELAKAFVWYCLPPEDWRADE